MKRAKLEVERAKPSKEQRKIELEASVKKASLQHMQKAIEYKVCMACASFPVGSMADMVLPDQDACCQLSRLTTSMLTCQIQFEQIQIDANKFNIIYQRSREELVTLENQVKKGEPV